MAQTLQVKQGAASVAARVSHRNPVSCEHYEDILGEHLCYVGYTVSCLSLSFLDDDKSDTFICRS